jgi:bacteriorhodopsin
MKNGRSGYDWGAVELAEGHLGSAVLRRDFLGDHEVDWAMSLPTLVLMVLLLIIVAGGTFLKGEVYRQESYSLGTLLCVLIMVLLLIRGHL